jgi:hypothetical protein
MFSCLKSIVSKINNLPNEGLRSCDKDEKADLHSRSWATGTESKRFAQEVHKRLINLLFIPSTHTLILVSDLILDRNVHA